MVDAKRSYMSYNFFFLHAVLYTIEFQKYGLPHMHILLWLGPKSKHPTMEDINSIICTKLPDKANNPVAYECVVKFMVHDPCGVDNPQSPCMKGERCSKHFSKKVESAQR